MFITLQIFAKRRKLNGLRKAYHWLRGMFSGLWYDSINKQTCPFFCNNRIASRQKRRGSDLFFEIFIKSLEYFLQCSPSPISVTTFFFVFFVILVFLLLVKYHFNHWFFFVISSAITLVYPFLRVLCWALDEEYISIPFLGHIERAVFSEVLRS